MGGLGRNQHVTVLFYNVDEGHQRTFGELAAAFDRLAECSSKWHVQASGAILDMTTRKRNAGASHLVNRTPTALVYRLPTVIQSNATPPGVRVGKQHLYFFPDVILVEQGNQFGAVSYADLQVSSEIARFIENGGVPGDAQVVDHTWRYPNKSGGPDRRFNNNTQIPVCLYESIHLASTGGLNEKLEFSRVGLVDSFAHALRTMPPSATANADASLRPWSATAQQQPLHPAPASIPEASAPPVQAKRMSGFAKVAVALLVVVGALALLRVSVKDPAKVTPIVNAAAPISAAPPPAASASQPMPPPQIVRQPPPTSTPRVRNDVPLTALEVRDLQTRLKALGYDPGDIDGITGPQTAAAIRAVRCRVQLLSWPASSPALRPSVAPRPEQSLREQHAHEPRPPDDPFE